MKYYTIDQAAFEMGITRKTLSRLIKHKGEHPPYLVIGKRKKFPVADLEAWLTDRKHW